MLPYKIPAQKTLLHIVLHDVLIIWLYLNIGFQNRLIFEYHNIAMMKNFLRAKIRRKPERSFTLELQALLQVQLQINYVSATLFSSR